MFLYRTLLGESIRIWGDGSVVRDYLHISDVVSALLKMMIYKGSERIFNIGSGKGTSLNEVLDVIRAVTGKKPDVIYAPSRNFDIDI